MKYTLIIPHYNDAGRLDRLLKSVPMSRTDVEVIVVDDCSPKQVELNAIRKSWPMVTWLSNLVNSGAGAARNVGLSNANGEYLVFADSDDEFLPGAFNVFDEHVGGDDDLVYFLAEGRQESNGKRSVRTRALNRLCLHYLEKKSANSLELLKLGHVVPWAKVYSKKYVNRIGVKFEETRVSNDIAFNVLAAMQAENVKVVPEIIYRVYRRGGSLTASSTPEDFLERMEVSARLATRLKNFTITNRKSATGYIVQSLSYDFKTVLKTIHIGITSDLELNVFRAFDPFRWFSYFRKQFVHQSEKKKAGK